MEEIKTFIPIAKTAEITGLAETYLRKLREENVLPGVQCGRRFMVNFPLFQEMLISTSTGSSKCLERR